VKLLIGTKNQGKIREILSILGDLPDVKLLTSAERPFSEVPETGETFQENALLKARSVSKETGLLVLAEDSGLEVEALKGAPGVRSARFAGGDATDEENIEKLLALLKDLPYEQRRARFVCVAVLHFPDEQEIIREGELQGQIAREPCGRYGFGYDPVFIPEGYDRTLAELGPAVKDEISHRRKALEQLREELSTILRF